MRMARVAVVVVLMLMSPQRSEGVFEQWCVADEQTPDDVLQGALSWACSQKDVDCSKIQGPNGECYLPDTMRDHASYAFNTYYQNYKHRGASCYFNGAAVTTETDPSRGSCRFEFVP